MPVKPNTDLYANPEFISDLVREVMVPNLPFLQYVPFKMIETTSIIAKRKSYSVDTDPKKVEPAPGASLETAWPYMSITLGDQVPLNTDMRKVATAFTQKDLNNPMFEQDARDVYTQMAWAISDQVNANLYTQLTTAANATAQHTNVDAAKSGVWSGAASPIDDLTLVAQDMSAQKGYKLDTVVLNTTNFYEMLRHIETADLDMSYIRDKVAPRRNFYDRTAFIDTIGAYVIGVDEGVAEGAVLGIGTFRGSPCVENFSYYDAMYNRKPIMDFTNDQGMDPAANIPLNVHTWDSQDGFEHNVYAWIDSVSNVPRPLGVFYEASII
jgi:hypothetical protein